MNKQFLQFVITTVLFFPLVFSTILLHIYDPIDDTKNSKFVKFICQPIRTNYKEPKFYIILILSISWFVVYILCILNIGMLRK